MPLPLRWGLGGTGGGCRKLWDPKADGFQPLSPVSSWSLSSCWDTGGTLVSLEAQGFFPRRRRGPCGWHRRSFRDQGPGEERNHCICWSWACIISVRPLPPPCRRDDGSLEGTYTESGSGCAGNPSRLGWDGGGV